MSVVTWLVLFIAQSAYATASLYGAWQPCNDLNQVRTDVTSISDRVHALLSSSSEQMSSTEPIHVVSADCQLVAGMNYRVTLDATPYTNVVIQYYMNLNHNISKLHVVDAGALTIADLTDTQATVSTIEPNIRSLLTATNKYPKLNASTTLSVTAATSRVENGGTTYTVTLDALPYTDIVISYYVGPPFLVMGAPINNPTNLKLVRHGYLPVRDLSHVRAVVESLRSDIAALCTTNAMFVAANAQMVVLSAKSQVANITTIVTLNIASYTTVRISYAELPSFLVRDVPTNPIVRLNLLTPGTPREGVLLGTFQVATDLTDIRAKVASIEADIRTLLADELLVASSSDAITVASAQYQVVAGMNYRVAINVGQQLKGVLLQYFIDLPVNDATQTPTHLTLLDLGTVNTTAIDADALYVEESSEELAGGFHAVTDLDSVKSDVADAADDIRAVLAQQGLLSASQSAAVIVVVSAEEQVVAGVNYRVTIDVGSFRNVVIQYLVPLPSTDPQQRPTEIKVVDNGEARAVLGGYQAVRNITLVERQVAGMEGEIVALLAGEGLDVAEGDSVQVVSAEQQVVAGTKYRVVLNVGRYQGVVVQYFVALPVTGVAQSPTQLEVVDLGSEMVLGDAGVMAGGWHEVDGEELEAVRAEVGEVEDSVRDVLTDGGLDVTEGDVIEVVSAMRQVVAGTNYRVTMQVGDYRDVVVQYFVDLPVNDATQTPRNVHLVDSGRELVQGGVEDAIGASRNVVLLVVAVALGVCVVVFCVAVSMCYKAKKKDTANGLYNELIHEENAIDANL